jgi:WS/DGAT/MGAT family acyltransferase
MSNPYREPMTSVDAAWLEMDRPTNPMVINGLMLFDTPIAFERLRRVLQERLVNQFDRFGDRVTIHPTTGQHLWEADPHFHISYHVRHIALPRPADEVELQRLVGDLMSEPIDRQRPLWRFYLIDNVNGGCAVFGRIHHCIGDGTALMRVLLSLTDPNADPSADAAPPTNGAVQLEPRRGSLLGLPWRLATGITKRSARLLISLMPDEDGFPFSPERLLKSAESAGLLSATSAAILAKLLIMAPDRPSAYRGELNGMRRVSWSRPFPLEKIKTVGRITGTTINDVLVAAVAGALRRDLEHRGENPAWGDLRAMVPMNLRPAGEELRLGNQFSLLYLALPISLAQPYARLAAVKRRMDLLKASPEPFLVFQILNLVGRLPGELAHQTVDWFADKASCVLTNVPGPRQPLYFAGERMSRMLFWVPHTGNLGMGISIFSYAGTVTIGIGADEALVPNPDRIVDYLHEEVDALCEFALKLDQAQDENSALVDGGQLADFNGD